MICPTNFQKIWLENQKNQNFVWQISRNFYVAPMVQLLGPENDLGSSYFHSSDFLEISFEILLWETAIFARRSISRQWIELLLFSKTRLLRLCHMQRWIFWPKWHSKETHQILFFPGLSQHFNPKRARTRQLENL